MAGVMLQKNDQNLEHPISFYNKTLRDVVLKCDIMEKQDYALFKALKDFRVYILHSHVVAYVPTAVVKDILTQAYPNGKRAKQIAVLLEYDLEIKPSKQVKGQGLDKMMTQSNRDVFAGNLLDCGPSYSNHIEQVTIFPYFLGLPWYKDIIYVLQNLQALEGLSKTQARLVKLKSAKFCILNGYLYWKDLGGVLLNCIFENEAQLKTKEFHQGGCGGHLYWKSTAHKILRASFYSPTLFSNVFREVSNCHQCQFFEGKRKLIPLTLKPILVESPFQ